MSIVASYYPAHFRKWQGGYRERRPKLQEGEGDVQKAFSALVSEAIIFFDEKRNDVIDLPMASAERSTVEAALGMLKQAGEDGAATENDLRSRIITLRDGLKELVEGADGENSMYRYVTSVVASLSDLYTQAGDAPQAGGDEPGLEPEGEPEPSPEPEGGEPDSGTTPEDEEGEDADSDENLAKALGVI